MKQQRIQKNEPLESWKIVKLGDITQIQSGGTPSRDKKEYWGKGTIPWLKSGELKDKRITKTEEKISELGLRKSSAKMFPKNSVLIALTGATVGKTAILELPSTTNQSVCAIFPNEKIEPEFLWYYLRATYDNIVGSSYGGAHGHIAGKTIKELLIPLPPLPVQKLIVKKLNDFFEKYNKLKQEKQKAKENYKRILGSVILGFLKSNKYDKKTLSEVVSINPKKTEISDLDENLDVSFIPMNYIDEISGSIKNKDVRKLKEVRKGYTYFKEGDVLFAKITPCMENGKAAITNKLKNKIGFGSTEFHVLRPKEDLLLPEFIFHYMRQPFFRQEAARKMTGTAGQMRVPTRFLEEYEMPVPPISEQKQIISKLEAIKAKYQKISEEQDKIEKWLKELPKAVLNRAFKGELI